MPKIISYTPSWLSRPSPGFHLFSSAHTSTISGPIAEKVSPQLQNGFSNKKTLSGPRRTIARRGTEIFVVVENEIRWSDLCMLKENWEEHQKQNRQSKRRPNGHVATGLEQEVEEEDFRKGSYRVLKFAIGEEIQQLSISPNGTFLAVLTSHTVHVVVLPDPLHLGQGSFDPIKLKGNTIGPTTHVLSQSRVVRGLWHPCGLSGSCLVTVTADAVVRIWELNRDNRWSFDSPTLAIDLTKLVVGTSEQEDFAPQRIGRNRGFSPDSVGMEVVSACFGGTGSSSESPWSAMTLWVAMQDGDVYALCPLLPTKWQPSSTLIPSLSIAAVAKSAAQQDEELLDSEESRRQRDQYRWISDIDGQEPILVPGSTEFSPCTEVYGRPSHPGPIPRLQGPFQILSEDSEEILEISDIYVTAARMDVEELMNGEDSDFESEALDEGGLSASVICLVTKDGRVYLCLDLDGVEGEWLPSTKYIKSTNTLPSSQEASLVLFEVVDTLRSNDTINDGWPSFSPDVYSRYSFFVTHSKGVYFLSFDSWLHSLENELQNTSNIGSAFRINVLKNGPGTLRERILDFGQGNRVDHVDSAIACVVLQDSDIGYFLLTAVAGQPRAATLDRPDGETLETFPFDEEYQYEPDKSMLAIGPTRAPYEPPESFWASSSLPKFFDKHLQSRHKKALKEEIRLSATTLDLMTDAHRILSEETYQLGVAAADLFRRCERLQDELRDQIHRANEAAYKIDIVLGNDADEYRVQGERETLERERGNTGLEQRLEDAKKRQKDLRSRHDKLRSDLAQSRGSILSEKEELFIAEVDQMEKSALQPSADAQDQNGDQAHSQPWQRYNEAKTLAQGLLARAKEILQEGSSNRENNDYSNDDSNAVHTNRNVKGKTFKIPPDFRKAKVAQVMELLDRESALVDAAQSRLRTLSLSSFP